MKTLAIFNFEDSISVEIDSSDQTMVAYMLKSGQIVGRVWLFNFRIETCAYGSNMPAESARNPDDNCKPHVIAFIEDSTRIRVFYNSIQQTVGIFVDGILTATMWEGAMPGRSSFASRDSNWALTMDVEAPIEKIR